MVNMAVNMSHLRPLYMLAVCAFLGLKADAQSPAPRDNAGPSRIIAVNIDSVIHPITVEILSRVLKQAENEHASAVLIRLNTPGGLLDATRGVVQRLLASPVPVITYVTPSGGRAASAGFFLLEAGDVAAMAPGTNTGAASPVLLGQQMDPVMRSKVENDSAAWLRSVTSRRGRNSDLAEKTIREAKAFTENEALQQHLIDVIAPNDRELLAEIEGRQITRWTGDKTKLHLSGALIIEARRTAREQFISSIADPNIGFILLVIGALGVYLEFTSPGLILPGVVGGILLLLGLSSLSVLPINWVGAALLCLAISFFILEVKFSSHGVLGTGGTAAMIIGALLLVDGPPELRIQLATALGVSIPFAVITLFLVSLVVRARRNKVITGIAGLMNEIGVAQTRLEPDGTVLIHGEYWGASSAQAIAPGAPVKVIGVNGLKLSVAPVET
jgi:membrane-bound serine protease (ClpP class)